MRIRLAGTTYTVSLMINHMHEFWKLCFTLAIVYQYWIFKYAYTLVS